MLTAPPSPAPSSQSTTQVVLVIGVAVVAVVGGLAFIALLAPGPGASSPGGNAVISICTPPAALGGPQIVGCSGIVTNVTTVTTPPIRVPADSLLLAFVSFVNVEIGGGSVESIGDSLGDAYSLLISTGFALNHTESLYAGAISTADPSFTVMVTFSGGDTPMGGSVAVVDIANASALSVDAFVATTGTAGPANVTVTAAHAHDVFLLGAAGRGVSGPYSAGPGMTLLDTGTATAGPFEDGVGYGTFATTSASLTLNLAADLNYPTYWEAIGASVAL